MDLSDDELDEVEIPHVETWAEYVSLIASWDDRLDLDWTKWNEEHKTEHHDGLGELHSTELSKATVEKITERLANGIDVYRGVKEEGRQPADPGDFGIGEYHSSSKARACQ